MSIVENYQTFVAISNQLDTVVQKFWSTALFGRWRMAVSEGQQGGQ